MNSHWGLILNVKHLLKQLDYLVSFSHWIFLYAIIANNNLINWTHMRSSTTTHLWPRLLLHFECYLVLACSFPLPCKRYVVPEVQEKVSTPRNRPRCPSALATNNDRPCWWSAECRRFWTRFRLGRTVSARPPTDHSQIVLERISVGAERS